MQSLTQRAAIVRRRRRGSFVPSQLSGLVLWLAADSLALPDATAVANWPDKSSAANNASQGTGANQPLFKTNIVNGKPVLRFDGVNSSLNLAAQINPAVITSFVVAKRSGGAGAIGNILRLDQHVFFGDTGQAGDPWGTHGGVSFISAGVDLGPAFKICAFVQRAISDLDLVTNGALVHDTTGTVLSGAINPNTISMNAGGQRFTGDVAEILVYSRAVSVAERQSVERYLGAKYGIGVP